ncbi:hypothetical protein EPT55_07745 [Fusobacterium necrophorum]|uniref:hypothetical protein n=1 Tax=Fusobacterium necrophorum TaxID=859 RepID=UPI0010116175|nr:hypothetical protein [Fusobacterium necrophorum]RXZ26907.1 hypothetical protein EPT55_07745 [Fusobacterium necrophorum]
MKIIEVSINLPYHDELYALNEEVAITNATSIEYINKKGKVISITQKIVVEGRIYIVELDNGRRIAIGADQPGLQVIYEEEKNE